MTYKEVLLEGGYTDHYFWLKPFCKDVPKKGAKTVLLETWYHDWFTKFNIVDTNKRMEILRSMAEAKTKADKITMESILAITEINAEVTQNNAILLP